jgi:hypothetical protein
LEGEWMRELLPRGAEGSGEDAIHRPEWKPVA